MKVLRVVFTPYNTRRFLDLTQAEAQAREAKIEAGVLQVDKMPPKVFCHETKYTQL